MSLDPKCPAWLFVIDTDSYAGNFERGMTYYCTGVEGEMYIRPEVSEDDMIDFHDGTISDDLKKEIDDKLDLYTFEEGHCTIYATPGWSNNGSGVHTKVESQEEIKWPAYNSVAIFFTAKPSDALCELMKNRASQYCYMNKMKMDRCRIIHQKVVVDITEEIY